MAMGSKGRLVRRWGRERAGRTLGPQPDVAFPKNGGGLGERSPVVGLQWKLSPGRQG